MARIEGVLDHDQSIVGLMALDIAAGRRWPIFFDGQRYMGAVEPYVAAASGRAVRPLAGASWRWPPGSSSACSWRGSMPSGGAGATGRPAIWPRSSRSLCAPMLVLWAIVPRGGYIELLAWAIPVLGVYRAWTRPGGRTPGPRRQAAWGFLFAFGYFLNPLSLIVYLTLALDWTFGRHGADLRRERSGLDPLGRLAARLPSFWGSLGVDAARWRWRSAAT